MALEIGRLAPNFTQKDQQGNLIKLSDFRGKKVLLYFYPHDSTPTCTAQACNLNENLSELSKNGIIVIGVSEDSQIKHQRFIEKNGLKFSLIADIDHKVIEKYGVWQEKKTFGISYFGIKRTSFLIDEKGKLIHIITKVESKRHAEQVMNLLNIS